MKRYREAFANIKRAYDESNSRPLGLLCKRGFYRGCLVLKLQKPSWTNDNMRNVPNETGIFFSIWLDKNEIRRNRAHYNIHALKLRKLKGYSLTSIEFAKNFRKAFRNQHDSWPNVCVDFGPQTLMQGWIEIDLKAFERDVLVLMRRFAKVSNIIDELLNQRIARPKAGEVFRHPGSS